MGDIVLSGGDIVEVGDGANGPIPLPTCVIDDTVSVPPVKSVRAQVLSQKPGFVLNYNLAYFGLESAHGG